MLGIAVFDEPLGGGVPGRIVFAAMLAVLVIAVVRVCRLVVAEPTVATSVALTGV